MEDYVFFLLYFSPFSLLRFKEELFVEILKE